MNHSFDPLLVYMAWRYYQRLLQTHPLKTKALTSSFITGLSDVCLQLCEKNSDDHATNARNMLLAETGSKQSWKFPTLGLSIDVSDLKWSRTLTLSAVGLLYSGPVNHFWFAALEKFVRTQHKTRSVMIKLALDQIMFVPAVISGYLTVRGVLERKSELQIRAQLQEKVAVATKAAWQFWPLVQLVSFSVVPVMYRVLFGNFCAIVWNARLSSISSQASQVPDQRVALSQGWNKELRRLGPVAASIASAFLLNFLEQAMDELPLQDFGVLLDLNSSAA